MTDKFSIYDSPLSDETKKIRRNSVLASVLCLFIGITAELPKKFALLGVGFESPQQQSTLGWFLFSVSAYLLIHFVSVAGVEVAKWIHPFFTQNIAKQELLQHPAFDESDFYDLWDKFEEQDKNRIRKAVTEQSEWDAGVKLKYLYRLVYLRLLVEIVVPVVLGSYGLFKLARLITSLTNGTA